MALTLEQLNAASPRGSGAAARRPVRAFALDRARRRWRSGRSARWRTSSTPWRASCADAGREAQLALIRAHPELAGKAMVEQDAHGRIHQRAEQGGPDRLHARRVREDPATQRRLQREVRLSLHPGGARAARHGPAQAGDHRHLRAPPGQPARLRTGRMPAQHPPHRGAAPERQVRRRAGAGQPGVGLAGSAGAVQRSRLQGEGPAHRHLPHRRAPRRRRRASRRT